MKCGNIGIIDKEKWEAVQEEFERREKFKKEHKLTMYSYGHECNPFTSRIFCRKCNGVYKRYKWRSRGIEVWKCKNHRVNGRLNCDNSFVTRETLEMGFVRAFNEIVETRNERIKEWERLEKEGSPLERVRTGQMIEITGQGKLERFVPEIAQLLIEEIIVEDEGGLVFRFLNEVNQFI